jgi:hypothetical protein
MSVETAPRVLSGSFPVPASLIIGTELADLVAAPPLAADGLTLHDVMDATRNARDALQNMQHLPEIRAAVDALDIAAAVYDEVTGMVPA